MARHVVIIGNGITGVTTARFVRKLSDDRITLISDESDYFFSRTALMYVYMGHMRRRDLKPYEDGFWARNRIERLRGYVESIDTDARSLTLRDGSSVAYDVLVLATGSLPNTFGWPGQDLAGVQGLYGLPDLDAMERDTEGVDRAVVVGGGLIGVEMAEMLHTRHVAVTFLVREASYMDYVLPPQESAMVNDEIRAHGIDLRLGTELKALLPDESGRVRAAVTAVGDELRCRFAGLTVGVHPRIDVVQGSGIEADRGILVNAYFETNVPGVYAAGDCAEFRRDGIGHRRIEQLWYSGRLHGKTLARTLCGQRTAYERGVFFNSAKFFGLEYQTYGDVQPSPEAGRKTFVWQDRRRRRLIRIDFAGDDGRVLGFNGLGVRLRQADCERWILERMPVESVVGHLFEAVFDPEFQRDLVPEVIRAFNEHYPELSVITVGRRSRRRRA